MKNKEMDKLTSHFDTYFEQSNSTVIHPVVMDPHIDCLLYSPNEKYPFWKLVTMGASDYKMKGLEGGLGDRNEYMMFVEPKVDLNDKDLLSWYYASLMNVATYSVYTNIPVTYGHSMEWSAEDGEEMIGAFLTMPQIIENVGVLRCKLGLFKTAVCLQVVLLNAEENAKLLEQGPEEFDNFLYPEDENAKMHYLCQRKRTEEF